MQRTGHTSQLFLPPRSLVVPPNVFLAPILSCPALVTPEASPPAPDTLHLRGPGELGKGGSFEEPLWCCGQ